MESRVFRAWVTATFLICPCAMAQAQSSVFNRATQYFQIGLLTTGTSSLYLLTQLAIETPQTPSIDVVCSDVHSGLEGLDRFLVSGLNMLPIQGSLAGRVFNLSDQLKVDCAGGMNRDAQISIGYKALSIWLTDYHGQPFGSYMLGYLHNHLSMIP